MGVVNKEEPVRGIGWTTISGCIRIDLQHSLNMSCQSDWLKFMDSTHFRERSPDLLRYRVLRGLDIMSTVVPSKP